MKPLAVREAMTDASCNLSKHVAFKHPISQTTSVPQSSLGNL